MACVMVDTAFPFSDEAMRLCRMLSNPLADALPTRLWCWGIETDRDKGVFEADADQLAKIVRFAGDSDLLLKAFIACEVIEPTANANEYRIKGWKRNARLFKERKRLRRLNATRGARVQNAKRARKPREENKLSSSSSSSFPVSKETGLLEQSADEEVESRSHLTPTHPEAHFFEAAYREAFGGGPFTAIERADVSKLMRQCIDAKAKWQDLIAAYKGDKFQQRDGSLTWLKFNARDVIRAIPGAAKGGKTAKPVETSEQLTARLNREAREGEERGLRGEA